MDQTKQIAIDQRNEAMAEKEKLEEEIMELRKQIYEAEQNKENEADTINSKKINCLSYLLFGFILAEYFVSKDNYNSMGVLK